ncbi:protein-tyrosine phosphatase-like protein [Earliella scabrosa]|nr:protein-tyrosine phosphatase-like protein [Earliella scabrosa]
MATAVHDVRTGPTTSKNTRKISRVASEPPGHHPSSRQPQALHSITPHEESLIAQLGRLASQHHASEYNRLKFGPRGSPLLYVPYSVQMPDHYREMQAHQLRCAAAEAWWIHRPPPTDADTRGRLSFCAHNDAPTGFVVSVDLHEQLSAAISSSIICPATSDAPLPPPQPHWQTSETHPIVISTLIPSETLLVISSHLRPATLRYPVMFSMPPSKTLDCLLPSPSPMDAEAFGAPQVSSPTLIPAIITPRAEAALSPAQSLAKSLRLPSLFWVHPTVRRAFLGGVDQPQPVKKRPRPVSLVGPSAESCSENDPPTQPRPTRNGSSPAIGEREMENEIQRCLRRHTELPIFPALGVAIPAVPSIPPGASAKLLGNLYMSSCPGKKVRLDGPVRGRNTVCRDLRTDLSRIKDVGVVCIICCLDDGELQSLGVSWSDYAQTADELGIDILRIPIPEGLAPLDPALLDEHLSKVIETYTLRGSAVLVHCRGGVGRAGIIACCWLLKLGLCGWLGSATMPESPLPPESELVDEETIHLVKRLIAVVRTRRSPKAVETYEQVKFLVDYIQFLQARASNPLSTMSLPLSRDLFADWDVSMD